LAGRKEALAELAPLFSKAKQLFALNMYLVKTDIKAEARRQAERLEAMELSDAPAASWGFPPAGKAVSSATDEAQRKFFARQRKNLAMYLQLLAGEGQLDVLKAAWKKEEWKEGSGLQDFSCLAKGMYCVATLIAARRLCPPELLEIEAHRLQQGAPEADDAAPAGLDPQLWRLAALIDTAAGEAILDHAYQIYEHAVLLPSAKDGEAAITWTSAFSQPAEAALCLLRSSGIDHGVDLLGVQQMLPQSEQRMQTFSMLYIHLLARFRLREKLDKALTAVKNRHKFMNKAPRELNSTLAPLWAALTEMACLEPEAVLAQCAELDSMAGQQQPPPRPVQPVAFDRPEPHASHIQQQPWQQQQSFLSPPSLPQHPCMQPSVAGALGVQPAAMLATGAAGTEASLVHESIPAELGGEGAEGGNALQSIPSQAEQDLQERCMQSLMALTGKVPLIQVGAGGLNIEVA
jgi:hypothetical protein